VELIQRLIAQFGISEQQANGGLGALLNLAQDKLSAGSMQEIAKLLPNLDELLKSAPASSGGLAALGGLFGGNMGELAKLVGQFSSLGLSQSQLAPFAKMAFEFLQQKLPPSARDELIKLAQPFIK